MAEKGARKLETSSKLPDSERMCVCGHSRDCHDENNYHNFCQPLADKHGCGCQKFRELFDWPNRPGWWYADEPYRVYDWQFVYAINEPGFPILRIGDARCIRQDSIGDSGLFIPARFIWLNPKDPFVT